MKRIFIKKICFRTFSRIAILSLLASPLLTIAKEARTPGAGSNCSSLDPRTPIFTASDIYKLPKPFSAPMRDNDYESAKAYTERVKVAKKEYEKKRAQDMAGRSLSFQLITGEHRISYNPDRGGFEIFLVVSSAKSRKDGEQVPYPVVESQTSFKSNERDIGLGAKYNSSNGIGFAFVKSAIKHPFIKGTALDFFFKYPAEKAKAVGKNARMVFVGESQSPWVFESYVSGTDWDQMKSWSRSMSYAAVNLVCAAVVDDRNLTILYEFK